MRMIKLRRDVFLMILTIMVGTFAGLLLSIINRKDWNTEIIVWNAIALVILLIIIWLLLKSLQVMYEEDEERSKLESKRLVNDTIDKTLKDLGLKK